MAIFEPFLPDAGKKPHCSWGNLFAQPSFSFSILEFSPKGEIQEYLQENSCLRTGTLTDSSGFCENSRLWKWIYGKTPVFIWEEVKEYGQWQPGWEPGKGLDLFYSVVNAVLGVHYCTPAVLGKGAVDDRAAPTKTASTVEDLQLLGLSISHQPG